VDPIPPSGAKAASPFNKGYGYATVVEILSAALQSGNYLKMLTGLTDKGERKPYGLGHFFIAINTENFMGADEFRKIAGSILRELRNAKKAPGEDKIYTAGEKEYIAWQENKDKGVKVDKSLINELLEVKKKLNIESLSQIN